MVNKKLLEEFIDASGIKIEALAEKTGISRQALWQKMNNKSDFTVTEVYNLCKILGITKMRDRDRIFFAKQLP